MPAPVILGHVSQSSINTSLCGYGVRTGREELCDACSVEASLCETEGSPETSTSGSYDDCIVLMVDDGVLASDDGWSFFGSQRLGSNDPASSG